MSNKNNFQDGLSRRGFLKTSLAAGITLATASIIEFVDPKNKLLSHLGIKSQQAQLAQAAGTYYYGSNSPIVRSPYYWGHDFFIGKTGVGTAVYEDGSFDTGEASAAGIYKTHEYWILKGPAYYLAANYRKSVPPYDIDYKAWGAAQARAACEHYFDTSGHITYVYGKTIFADIEGVLNDADHYDQQRDDGWETPNAVNQTNDQLILQGWLEEIYSHIHIDRYGNRTWPRFIPGVYITPGKWNEWFGSDYRPSLPFVVWAADIAACGGCPTCRNCAGDYSPMCANCHPTGSNPQNPMGDAAALMDNVKLTKVGGFNTIIWQYWFASPGCPGPNACGDQNISIQNGDHYFLPVPEFTYLTLITSDGSSGNMMAANRAYPAPQNAPSTGRPIGGDTSTPPYPSPDK
jgi:hypothetical protein